MSPARGDALSRQQASEILRYWLASLRLEEALSLRPRARRVEGAARPPQLDSPSPGQVYFKVPLDAASASMLAGEAAWSAPLDAERTAFFEDWLHAQYRRAEDDASLTHLFCFPVVHLPRGELAGLLRAPVKVRFSTDGTPFRPPSWAVRKSGTYPAPPTELSVTIAQLDEGTWPFFLDTRLLASPLGVSPDDVDALFDALRARESTSPLAMLTRVLETLESAAGTDATHENEEQPRTTAATIDRLRRAMQTLLDRSSTQAKVYPVGIVLDATRAKATWHLQRELTALAEGSLRLERDGCLERYLTGRATRATLEDSRPQRALYDAPALTERQRQAADHAWKTSFAAVQGPPGTGKTTVILHLAAEALVRRIERFVDTKQMGDELFLVASSNNRAVDNVLEGLQTSGLPLALRVGSRLACAGPLTATLRRTRTWLEHARVEPDAVHREALDAALVRFVEARTAIDALLEPQRVFRERAEERATLERTIAELTAETGGLEEGESAKKRSRKPLKALRVLIQRTTELSRMCEASPNAARLSGLTRFYTKTVEPALSGLEQVASLGLEWPLPPSCTSLDVVELTEAWEEAAELALTRLEALRDELEQKTKRARRLRKLASATERLAALRDEGPVPPIAWSEHEPLARALFRAAVEVREAWARAHAAELCEALDVTLSSVLETRSLRPLFRQDAEAATILRELFGVWGSTLLSLGNCLPPEPGTIARVVLDEAGQCHPAHAISALVRSDHALFVGDVHQLMPVIELGVDDDQRLIRTTQMTVDPELLAPYRLHSESTTSAQALGERAAHERHSLVDHFRCDPTIIAISDKLCRYGLDVHTQNRDDVSGVLRHPVSLIDVQGTQEPRFGSWYNERELRTTLLLLDRLLARGRAPADIAIITPYRAQLELLRRGLVERGIPLEASPELVDEEDAPRPRVDGLALGTVHRFQGGERSVVLFSSVITRARSLPFLNERPNLLNVAISRARDRFVCIGDASTLARGTRTRLLVDAAERL